MLNALQWFVDLGSIVVLPILIFIFGIILGTKPGKAFTSALTVGVGFVGLNLVIDLLSSGNFLRDDFRKSCHSDWCGPKCSTHHFRAD